MGRYRLTDMFVQHSALRQNVDVVARPDRHVSPRRRWCFALIGSVLSLLVLLVMHTLAAPPAPASPPDTTAATAVRKAYVGLFKDQAIGVLDTATNRVLHTIAVPPGQHGLVMTPDGRKVYVSSDGASTVSVIDTASDRVVGSIEVGPTPHGLAISPDGRQVLMVAQSAGQAIPPGNAPAADHGTQDVRGKAEVHLEADDYYFEPTFLRGQPGQTVKLEVENESGTLHNLSLPDQGLDKDIPPKGTVEVAVTFPPSGELRFFCKFHSALGMHGALLAGDAAPAPVSQSTTK